MAFNQILLYLVATAAFFSQIAEGCNIHNRAPISKGIGRRRHSINETSHRLRTALANVRVWDGYEILEPGTIFFENDTIVPFLTTAADVVIDGQGGILLPGFIDSHAHPDTIAALEDLASFGVSTVLTMACNDYNVCNSLRNQVGLSQYFSSGIAAHGTSLISPGPPDYVNVTTNASTNAAAEQFVSYVFGNESDYMKIVSNQEGPDLATQSALVAFAHARGKTTMTHATLLEFYNPAILSKTNGLQHSPGDGLLSPDMISLMVEQKQFVTPTMEIAHLVLNIANTLPPILAFLGQGTTSTYETWRANVVAMHQAGIPILAGTDAAPIIPINGSAFGWTLHEELANLVDAGLTTGEALRSATLIPSLLHNLPTRGKIAPGMRADLILLSPGADPVKDIGATKNLSRVWIGGVEYGDVAQQPFLNSSTITVDPAVLAALL